MKLNVKALSRSVIATITLITILTIWGELSKQFKTVLASITGHHWVTKGVVSLVFFVAIYFIFSRLYKDSLNTKKEIYSVIWSTILGGLIIFLFYVGHFFS